MFLAAHAFCGLLIGIAFMGFTNDRRAIPVCIAGSLLPDLIDKPLALIVPALGSGRTLGHTLLCCVILLALAAIVFRKYHSILGLAFACSVFSHQICDTLWELSGTWFFPYHGPFPLTLLPDAGYYLRLQMTSPSEWLFLVAGLVLLGGITGTILIRQKAFLIAAAVMGIMGLVLIISAIAGTGDSAFAPSYDASTSLLAGIVAVLGAGIFLLLSRGIHFLRGDSKKTPRKELNSQRAIRVDEHQGFGGIREHLGRGGGDERE